MIRFAAGDILAEDAEALVNNERKRRFPPRQIALARDVLADKGWIAPARATGAAAAR